MSLYYKILIFYCCLRLNIGILLVIALHFSKVKKKKQADGFLSYKAPGFAPEETSTFLVIVNQSPKDDSSNITKDSDDDNVIIAFRGKEVRGVRKTAEVGNSVIYQCTIDR